MRNDHDRDRIKAAKARSMTDDIGAVAIVLGPSDEVLTFAAGELVDYENTAAMRQER